LVALCRCFLQSWILLTLLIVLWYVLVFRASSGRVVVLYCLFPSVVVCCICWLPDLCCLFSRDFVLFFRFLLVGVCWCLVGIFLWVFDVVFGVPLYCITVVVLWFIVDVVLCCCFGSYLAGLTFLIIRSSLVEFRCFSVCVGSLSLF
jgi:hypothetical protein